MSQTNKQHVFQTFFRPNQKSKVVYPWGTTSTKTTQAIVQYPFWSLSIDGGAFFSLLLVTTPSMNSEITIQPIPHKHMKQNLSFKTFLQDFQSSLIEAKFDDFLMNIFLKIFLYYTANFQFCMNDIIQKQATVWSENYICTTNTKFLYISIFAQQIQSF